MKLMRGGGGSGWWFYANTRATAYFGAGGWIALSPTWLYGQWREERLRRARVRSISSVDESLRQAGEEIDALSPSLPLPPESHPSTR